MDVRLKVISGANDGQEVAVPGPKFFVGRAEDCHMRPKSEMISRHHCALMIEGSTVALRDFGSKNGTFVNGQRVGGETILSPGDQLSIGPLRFEVVIEHQVGGKKKPKVRDMQEAALRTATSEPDVDDVSQWLMDDENSDVLGGSTIHSQELTMSDTRTLASEDTGVMGNKRGGMPRNDAADDDDDEEELKLAGDEDHTSAETSESEANQTAVPAKQAAKLEPEKKEKPKSNWLSKLRGSNKKPEAGKLPTAKGPSAVDTTEAANEMLRKMAKKR